MTMTEADHVDEDRAARLARLQARRGTTSPPAPPVASPPGGAVEREADPTLPATPSRRRSPASNAKIVTVGVSTTAMLGMIAGYGIADGMTTEAPTAAAAAPVAPVASAPVIPPASPTTSPAAPVATAPPQVIVVLVDGRTGRPVSTTTGSGIGVLDEVLGTVVTSPASASPDSAPTGTPTTPPVPVAVPTAVDLAVPAAPRPAPQAAPAPQPAPQASTGGS